MRTLAMTGTMVLCLAVSACAGTGGANGLGRSDKMDGELDVGKVVTVNQWATHRHATVMWVNYPVKPQERNTQG
jgi:hypothetical protein